MTSGTVPIEWKTARVIPLFKEGQSNDMSNYRPISILPAVSKILGRAVQRQLTKYLHEHKLLSPYQNGFRKMHSTEFTVISLTDTIRRNIHQGQLTGTVFIDMSKGFDSINHVLLLEMLRSFGIMNEEILWFENYISDRTQVVDYQNTFPEPQPITSGVPQESILGPLLFVLFVNDMPDLVKTSHLLMYADDAVLYCADKDVHVIERKLNEELNTIATWLSEISLFLNKKKTKCMLFGTCPKLKNIIGFNIKIQNYVIENVTEFSYLGIVLDKCLSWNDHIKYVISRAGKRIGMLGRIRSNLTIYCANTVYTSYIRPILDYCDTVWSCCGKGNTKLIEKLQRRAARIVMKSDSSDNALDNLKWEVLEARRNRHTFNLVKKCLVGRCPNFLRKYFMLNREVVSRMTRQSKMLHTPKVRTEIAKQSFFYNGRIIYNRHISGSFLVFYIFIIV